eukprot:968853-Pyramimonas_sp.AAC.1
MAFMVFFRLAVPSPSSVPPSESWSCSDSSIFGQAPGGPPGAPAPSRSPRPPWKTAPEKRRLAAPRALPHPCRPGAAPSPCGSQVARTQAAPPRSAQAGPLPTASWRRGHHPRPAGRPPASSERPLP